MKRRAFTLPELMIVVLTISILLVIAIPNFYKARATSRLHEILGQPADHRDDEADVRL
jgi:prepilin-type N-terminal cleavage/methylation domain-containing protein